MRHEQNWTLTPKFIQYFCMIERPAYCLLLIPQFLTILIKYARSVFYNCSHQMS